MIESGAAIRPSIWARTRRRDTSAHRKAQEKKDDPDFAVALCLRIRFCRQHPTNEMSCVRCPRPRAGTSVANRNGSAFQIGTNRSLARSSLARPHGLSLTSHHQREDPQNSHSSSHPIHHRPKTIRFHVWWVSGAQPTKTHQILWVQAAAGRW